MMLAWSFYQRQLAVGRGNLAVAGQALCSVPLLPVSLISCFLPHPLTWLILILYYLFLYPTSRGAFILNSLKILYLSEQDRGKGKQTVNNDGGLKKMVNNLPCRL